MLASRISKAFTRSFRGSAIAMVNRAAFFGTKIVPIKLGDLGEGTKEATIKEWFVEPGKEVAEFDDLCEVFTDKLVAKIPSSHAGKVVKLHYKPDDICQVGDPLLDMEVDESAAGSAEVEHKEEAPEPPKQEEAPKAAAQEKQAAPAPAPAASLPPLREKALATGAVRRLAKEMSIDINLVRGSGKDGRVTKGDLISFQEGGQQPEAAISQAHVYVPMMEDKPVKISGIVKAMTKSMTEAASVPMFALNEEFYMDNLMKLRKHFIETTNQKISYMPFFIKAASLALKEFPILNSWSGHAVDANGIISEYIEKAAHNISIAVDSPTGLLVPNLKNVQVKSILQINEEMKALIDRAKQSTLTNEDLSDGTFTLSNVGNIGGISGMPVLFRPQSAIAALGRIQERLRMKNEQVVQSNVITLSLVCDHRIIDGATGARFSAKMKQYVEDPEMMLLAMH